MYHRKKDFQCFIFLGRHRHDLELHDVCRRVEQEGGLVAGASLASLASVRTIVRSILHQCQVGTRASQ